jgi:hypothetical protein
MRLISRVAVAGMGMSFASGQLSAQSIRLSAPVTVVDAGSAVMPAYAARLIVLAVPDGSLFIVRGGEGRIDRVRADGTMRQVARSGDGPGEFRMISAAGLRGDSLWVVDELHRRLTMLPKLGAGRPLTTRITSNASKVPSASAFLPFVLSDEGDAWALRVTDEATFNLDVVKRMPIVRTNYSGIVRSTRDVSEQLDVWSRTHMIALPGVRAASYKAQLFSDRSLVAASANGRFWAIVNQADPSEAASPRREISLYSGSGKQLARVAVPLPPERLTPAVRDALIDSVVHAMDAELRKRGAPGSIAPAFRQHLFVPQMRTPVSDLVVADDGALLIRGNAWGRASVVYVLMSSAGSVTARFTVPSHQVIKAFTSSRVWSLMEDEDGQVRLVVQQFVR